MRSFMKVPVFNLTRQYQHIEPEIKHALLGTLRRGFFILGSHVASFEKSFASYVGAKYAIGVGSGTDALTLALQVLGIGPHDEIIVPANAYPSAFGLALTHARLRLIDVRDDGNLDPTLLASVISKKTRAIIPVHLYGNPADIPAIQKILRLSGASSRTALIEDCAQAHGATIQKRHVGTFGTIGCFSFYPSKNLGAYGDAGMLVTNNKTIERKLRALRMYGEVARYQSVTVSGVSRLDELHAAVLRVKLKHLTKWNLQRKKLAIRYQKELEGVGDIRYMHSAFDSSHHLFVIRTKRRDRLQTYLATKNIQTAIHYPVPVHLTRAFRYLGYKKGDFPVAEALSREVLSLPLFPELSMREQEIVIKHIKRFFLI